MNNKIQITNPLSVAVIGYLALPVVVFWCGWFAWWVVAFQLAAISYQLSVINYQLSKIKNHTSYIIHSTSGIVPLISQIIIAFAWTYLAGVGGFRPQHFDYYKHNLILNNLVLFDWPVRYADGHYLCYYNAYYLVPALLAKIWGGVSMVNFYMFGWAWLGLTLLFRLLHKIGGWGFVGLFVLFNSAETVLLVYEALKSPDTIAATLADLWTNDHTIELIVTPGGLTYPSHVESLTAVPQHAIGGWLAVAVIIYQLSVTSYQLPVISKPFINHQLSIINHQLSIIWLLLTALMLYWSPFVALGLLLIFGLSWVLDIWLKSTPAYGDPTQAEIGLRQSFIIRHLSFINILTTRVRIKLPLLSFYILNSTFYIIIAAPALLYYAGHVPMHDPSGLITQFVQTPHQYLLLATFLVIEAIVWGILIWAIERKHGILKSNYRLVIIAVGILFVLPFYHYGHFNDFMRRVSLPASMVLCWGLWQLFVGLKNQKSMLRYGLITCLAVASILPIKHHLRWFTAQPYMGVTNKSVSDFSGHTIHYLQQYHRGEFDVTAQYLGDSNSVYWQYCTRK